MRLIGGDDKALPNEVEISFRGQVVERLTRTHIVFWNSGKALLRGSDIVEDDPLRCECAEGSRILDARVVTSTRPSTKFAVQFNSNIPDRVAFTFDYLDPGDGAVVELLHTDPERYPAIRGTMRGVPTGCLNWGRIARSTNLPLPFQSFRRPVAMWTMAAMGFVTLGSAMLLPDSLLTRNHLDNYFRTPLLITGAAYIVLPALFLWMTRRRYPNALRTEELEE
jgi:hypothetical protein